MLFNKQKVVQKSLSPKKEKIKLSTQRTSTLKIRVLNQTLKGGYQNGRDQDLRKDLRSLKLKPVLLGSAFLFESIKLVV